jgi:hypothetical protein
MQMPDPKPLEDLLDYLARTTGLTRSRAAHLLEDVMGFLDELPEEFVCRRHRELQREGCPNPEIFVRIAAEMTHRRFRAPSYSPRQIRRMIYG